MMNSESARQQMVEQQVRTWDVFDELVLETMSAVPRDRFVPPAFAHCAYADAEIPLANGQCMLRPSIAGRILQAVRAVATDKVLEVGTGTGYLTECLARMADSVTSIDIFEEFTGAAAQRLEDRGVRNVDLRCMDATKELPAGAYDCVIVTASMAKMDSRLVDKLTPGGRLFVVIGEPPAMTATLVRRGEQDGTMAEDLFETHIPPMVAEPEAPVFLF